MAVPKHRQSDARKNSRHKANFKAGAVTLIECPHCKELTQPHKVCASCGYYGGKEVVTPKKEKKDKAAK